MCELLADNYRGVNKLRASEKRAPTHAVACNAVALCQVVVARACSMHVRGPLHVQMTDMGQHEDRLRFMLSNDRT